MHSNSDNIEHIIGNNTNKAINELLSSLLNRKRMDLQALTKGSDFVFDSINRIYYKYHKMSLRRAGQYTDSSDCIKKKKSNNKLKSNNNSEKCFQIKVAAAIKPQNSERISKIKPFINNFNWEEYEKKLEYD